MEKSESFLSFIEKNKNSISKTVDLQKTTAKILTTNESDLILAGTFIEQGKIVAFPTETVYGLGADALNESAVHQIFKTKNRPLTDPVIVHVNDVKQALSLVDINTNLENLFLFLVQQFWPGPLTIIMKAKNIIPNCVTANTGFVGIRCPNSEVAQKLIRLSNRPIAAPSANLFSHVSPTSALHVFNDLYNKDISIIDGDNCKFGIESTVIKICESEDRKENEQNERKLYILVLRNGSISEQAIMNHLKSSEIYQNVEVCKLKKENTKEIEENAEAPGQLLKHYSPLCDTYLLEIAKNSNLKSENIEKFDINLKECVLIDFGNVFSFLKHDVLDYCCLSEKSDLLEAMNKLYDGLRWGENIANVKNILITNIDVYFDEVHKNIPEFFETVYDKTYRSSSGKKLIYEISKKQIFSKKL